MKLLELQDRRIIDAEKICEISQPLHTAVEEYFRIKTQCNTYKQRQPYTAGLQEQAYIQIDAARDALISYLQNSGTYHALPQEQIL